MLPTRLLSASCASLLLRRQASLFVQQYSGCVRFNKINGAEIHACCPGFLRALPGPPAFVIFFLAATSIAQVRSPVFEPRSVFHLKLISRCQETKLLQTTHLRQVGSVLKSFHKLLKCAGFPTAFDRSWYSNTLHIET